MWVWVNSGSWWWTGRPGMLWFMGSQRVRHDWVTELNWIRGERGRTCRHKWRRAQKQKYSLGARSWFHFRAYREQCLYFIFRIQGPSQVEDDNFRLSKEPCYLSSVQSLFVIPWTAARQASLSITTSQSLLKLMSIESVMPFSYLILCHPLLPPSIFPSIRVFSSESVLCIRWPKDWSFSISLSNEYSGLISSRMDWWDLLAVLGTLKSLLQHRISKASILRRSAFQSVKAKSHTLQPSSQKFS